MRLLFLLILPTLALATPEKTVFITSPETEIFPGEVCYKECREGMKDKKCNQCLKAFPDLYSIDDKSAGSLELHGCHKSSDALTIICPDGEYEKKASIDNSLKEVIKKEKTASKIQKKKTRNKVQQK